ncbi:MAG: hypothetical protein LKM30_07010 [Bacilli bacterium]|jgi:hypothetical protein|nr:hypothetical protein [Bacilli bacterium]
MTLTLFLFLLIPIFVLPAIFLPLNRVRMFLYGTVSAFVVVGIFYLLNLWLTPLSVSTQLGRAFRPLSAFLVDGHSELSLTEKYHLSFTFFLMLLYFLVYLIVYLLCKLFFIGSNPSFHKPVKAIRKVIDSSLFLVSTYLALALFFINIREILPFGDGFLSWLFALIYPLEA